MGNSKSIVLGAALLLGACGDRPALAPATMAPPPARYTCEQEKKLAAEFKALPTGSMLKQAMNDYHVEREELAAARKERSPRCQ
jgi:hypothetical protein